jgi:hypothetical protein
MQLHQQVASSTILMMPPLDRRNTWLQRLRWVFFAMWVGFAALWEHYGLTRSIQPEPQYGRVYQLEWKGRLIYITSSEWCWFFGLQIVGGGGALLTTALLLRFANNDRHRREARHEGRDAPASTPDDR